MTSTMEAEVVAIMKNELDEEVVNRIDGWRKKVLSASQIASMTRIDIKMCFIISKFFAENLRDESKLVDTLLPTIHDVCDKCYVALLSCKTILMEKADNHFVRMYAICGNLGFSFHKRNLFQEGLAWCLRSMECYHKILGAVEKNSSPPVTITLIAAECYMKLNNIEEGLSCLANSLLIDKSLIEIPDAGYDIFGRIPWGWNAHWLQLKALSKCDKTVIDYLRVKEVGDQINIAEDSHIPDICKHEINVYMAGRQAHPRAIICAGDALLKHQKTSNDAILGNIAKAVGLWWGNLSCVDEAIRVLDATLPELTRLDCSFKKTESAAGNHVCLLTSMVCYWKGLCYFQKFHRMSSKQLENLNDVKEKMENSSEPDKSEMESAILLKTIPGISSLTLAHESIWASMLIDANKAMLALCYDEDLLKEVVSKNCPALVLKTCRLAAHLLSSLGDILNAVKCWTIVFKLAKAFERHGLLVLACTEIIKNCPSYQESNIYKECKEIMENCIKDRDIKHNASIYHRILLSQSIACFHSGQFEQGLSYLVTANDNLSEETLVDSTMHLKAEVELVCSMYKTLKETENLDFSCFPTYIQDMSPLGLALKGLKLFGAILRAPCIEQSGWTDINHNYFVVSSIMNYGSYTLETFVRCARDRECYRVGSDLVHLSTTYGFISRCVGFILYLIPYDIQSRCFDSAQLRIDTLNQILLWYQQPEEARSQKNESEIKTFLSTLNLKSLDWNVNLHTSTTRLLMNLLRLNSVSDLQWNLKNIPIQPNHYKDRCPKNHVATKSYLNPLFSTTVIKAPRFLRHSLDCQCYICLQPLITQSGVLFLMCQAMYAEASKKPKTVLAILETAKLLHQRALFRMLLNKSFLTESVQKVLGTDAIRSCIDILYSSSFIESAIKLLSFQMALPPPEDLNFIIDTLKQILDGISLRNKNDLISKSFPISLACAALYKRLRTDSNSELSRDDIRKSYAQKIKGVEDELYQHEGSPVRASKKPAISIPRKAFASLRLDKIE